MQRRVIPAVVAVIIAGLGAFFLYNYVNTADKRALEGQQATDVLIVTKLVPNGTTAADVAPYVQVRQLPKLAVVPGAVTNLTDVSGLATTSDLQVGEQVLGSRFAEPGTTSIGDVAVPTDKQEVSIQLEAQQVVGSTLLAGDKVAIYFTVGEETRLSLTDILITKVQGGMDPAAADQDAAPAGGLMLTLALNAKDVERLVYTQQSGKIWMSRVTKESADQTTSGVTAKNVFK